MAFALQPRLARIALVAVLAFSVSACQGKSPLDGPPDAKLTYSEVRKLADEAARAKGIELSKYNEPVLRFNKSNDRSEWWVGYSRKEPGRIGGTMSIVVNDDTKESRIVPGL
jgi:hypothetical protein